MGATSNEAKQRWNSSHYTQIKVSIQPGLAEAFKAKCKSENVSMANKISQFMILETNGRRPEKPTPDPYSTRQKRRKALDIQMGELEAMLEAERGYMENIPENLQSSCFFEAAEQTVSALGEALDILAGAY